MPRVAIGGTQEHQHLLALVDRNTAELERETGSSKIFCQDGSTSETGAFCVSTTTIASLPRRDRS